MFGLPRRDGLPGRRHAVGRREDQAGAGPARRRPPQPAAARRADQQPRPAVARRPSATPCAAGPGPMVLVSHDAEFVTELAPDRVLLMPDGTLDYMERRPARARLASLTADGVPGWKAEAFEFYEGLEADNTKAPPGRTTSPTTRSWCSGRCTSCSPSWRAEFGEGNVFRPYRDVRFSADKSAVQDQHRGDGRRGSATSSCRRRDWRPGRATAIMAADQLDRYRRAVGNDATGGALDGIAAVVEGKGLRADRARVAEDRAAGLPEGPSADRAAPRRRG